LRNQSLRYLSGQPADALLFLFAKGESLLVPWDLPMARTLATADQLIPYETYSRSIFDCIKTIFQEGHIGRAELSGILSYPLVKALKEALPGVEMECRDRGIEETIHVMRMVKDSEEIELLRQACRITDALIEAVPVLLDDAKDVSEVQLALFLEAEARKRGAEGMGFDTLAASAKRSFAIHCFPNFTSDRFGTEGFSILDFGVRFAGYTSDVTITVARGPLNSKQEAMAVAVQQAYDLAQTLCEPGADPVLVGNQIQEFFENRGFHMPHSLGHGIGLDAHEAPLFRLLKRNDGQEKPRLMDGMVFAVEPGLYDPEAGGVRLENDFLCTAQGTEVLTAARILYL
ncbi:MAG: aminopeptidase P family protein, partial [Spirochaetales bacterium]|nr:aminopeptidase P family protein [Spirochaetales bacterium]